jgi:ADP-ribose pyrophosphatase
MLKSLRQIHSELLHENPWWQYRKDIYVRPDKSEGQYYYAHTPGSVMIIPVTEDGNLILVKQYRYLNQKESLEFIGGGIKKGKNAEESAREELHEEAGIIADELKKVGEFNPMNGVTDEICNIFVARSLKRTIPKPEAAEEFEILELSVKRFSELISEGLLWDGMTLAAFAMFTEHENDFLK